MTAAHDRLFRNPPYTVRSADMTVLSQTMDWFATLYGLEDRWKLSQGENAVVAVLDTGVDLQHPDLSHNILEARDFTGSPYGPSDLQGHGTHCAGLVAAENNDLGVVGVAPKAKLLIGKVLGDNGAGSGQAVAAGMRWAASKQPDIVSMSLGSPYPDEQIGAALEELIQAGIIVVCAAGNSGRGDALKTDVNYPARWKGRPSQARDNLAVAAHDRNGNLASFSSRGEQVDVAGPGVDVLSTFVKNGTSGYAVLSGTSMATPIIAGCLALRVSLAKKAGKKYSLVQARADIAKSATDAGDPGKDAGFGCGIFNPKAFLALATTSPTPAPEPAPTPPAKGRGPGYWVFLPETTGIEVFKVKA